MSERTDQTVPGYKERRDPRAVRRPVIGFALGVLFGVGPLIPLLIGGGRTTQLPGPIAVAIFVSLGLAAPLSIFSAFSWALFYRCPNCRERLKRLIREPLPDDTGYSLKYACARCRTVWNVFWQERAGDNDGGA